MKTLFFRSPASKRGESPDSIRYFKDDSIHRFHSRSFVKIYIIHSLINDSRETKQTTQPWSYVSNASRHVAFSYCTVHDQFSEMDAGKMTSSRSLFGVPLDFSQKQVKIPSFSNVMLNFFGRWAKRRYSIIQSWFLYLPSNIKSLCEELPFGPASQEERRLCESNTVSLLSDCIQ